MRGRSRGIAALAALVGAAALAAVPASPASAFDPEVFDLGVDPHGLAPVYINDRGEIAGVQYHDNSGGYGYFRSADGTVTDLGRLHPDARFSQVVDMNADGVVAGFMPHTADSNFDRHVFRWDAVNGMVDVTPEYEHPSYASAINASGTIAGYAPNPSPGMSPERAHTWHPVEGDTMLDHLPGGYPTSLAWDINDAGYVVGQSGTPVVGNTYSNVAVMWEPDGTIHELGTLGGDWSAAMAINNAGQVFGRAETSTPDETRMFVWDATNGMVDTGLEPCADVAVNDHGVVATGILVAPFECQPVTWDSVTGVTPLPLPADIDLDDFAVQATSINNVGDVVGVANGIGYRRTLLWDTKPDRDGDSVPRSVEGGAPNDGDGNNDGTPDYEQEHVTSLRSGGTTSPYITIAGPDGSSFVDVAMQPPPAVPPPGVGLPLGLLGFELHDVPVGAVTTVDYFMPAGAGVTEFYKYDGVSWSEFDFDGTTGAEIDGDVARLHIQDGGRGDLDGVANGVIVDPIAAASPLSLSIGNAAVVEGNTGRARTVQFAITLSEPATSLVTVDYTIKPTGSAEAPADFDNKRGKTTTLKIKPAVATGKTNTVVYVSAKVAPDLEIEGDQTFDIELSNATGGYGIGDAVAAATILDDETGAGPTTGTIVSVGDAGIYEGDVTKSVKTTNNAKVWINLSQPATSTVSVTATVAGDTATVGTDYKLVRPKVLTFKAGQWQKALPIGVFADIEADPDETVTITLSNPTAGLDIGRAVGTLVIMADDGE